MEENKTPQEVVFWYTPPKGEEVTEYYIQENDFPEKAKKQSKKKKKGALIFAIIFAVVFLGTIAAIVIWQRTNVKDVLEQNAIEDGKAASIVEITMDEEPKLKKYRSNEDFEIQIVDAEGKEKMEPEDIYEKVRKSTVFVMSQRDEREYALGTGSIISSDGYILTNAHIIAGAKETWVSLYNNYTYECELVGYCTEEDIAILHCIDAHNLPYAEIGNSDECKVGQSVYAIGNPLGTELVGTFTSGIISYKSRNLSLDGNTMVFMQTDTPVNSGNSGGPLINAYGQVIGVMTLKMGNTMFGTEGVATVENLGFAIPSEHFCRIVNEIIATGKYDGAPTLGITVAEVGSGSNTFLEAVTVEEGLGGYEAGVQPGDIILKADGIPVTSINKLLEIRNSHKVNDTMTLTLRRADGTFEVEVKLYSSLKK